MRIIKIPGLILIFAGIFFGIIQLVNMATGRAQDMSLIGILLKLDPNGGSAVRNMLPSGLAQDLFEALLRAPVWLVALCLGAALWFTARAFGDDD